MGKRHRKRHLIKYTDDRYDRIDIHLHIKILGSKLFNHNTETYLTTSHSELFQDILLLLKFSWCFPWLGNWSTGFPGFPVQGPASGATDSSTWSYRCDAVSLGRYWSSWLLVSVVGFNEVHLLEHITWVNFGCTCTFSEYFHFLQLYTSTPPHLESCTLNSLHVAENLS